VVSASLFVSSSARSADFFVRLCDVLPGGASFNICDGICRVQLADAPGSVACVEVELSPIAYRFKPAHRIRLQLSSGAHPRFMRNMGTGEPFDKATFMCPALQRVYFSETYVSRLVLPIVESS